MTIWLYSLFGEEEVLIPYFMRHYAPMVDRLIMLDGGSNDATRAIIREYPNATIEQSPFAHGGYDERENVKYLSDKYKEARSEADWVIIVDVDEFVYSSNPLPDMLSLYRASGIRAVELFGFQMLANEPPKGDDQITDMIRLGIPDHIYNKMSVFDPALDVKWSIGRHSCAIPNLLPARVGLKLLHYRYFGEAYTRERNAKNYTRKSERDLIEGNGYHCYPDYIEGRYSIAWFESMFAQAKEVI